MNFTITRNNNIIDIDSYSSEFEIIISCLSSESSNLPKGWEIFPVKNSYSGDNIAAQWKEGNNSIYIVCLYSNKNCNIYFFGKNIPKDRICEISNVINYLRK